MPDQPRPVWLTREQREGFRELMFGERVDAWQVLAPLVNAWDAAPADATEAVLTGYLGGPGREPTDMERVMVDDVLRALGAPDA